MQQAPTKPETVALNVQLDANVRADLARMADADERSLTGEVSWLIKQEAERRGIKPESATSV